MFRLIRIVPLNYILAGLHVIIITVTILLFFYLYFLILNVNLSLLLLMLPDDIALPSIAPACEFYFAVFLTDCHLA